MKTKMNSIRNLFPNLIHFGIAIAIIISLFGSITTAQEETQSQDTTQAPVLLEEIIVTGERVERSVKETSSSIRVFGNQELQDIAGPAAVHTILELTPNLLLNGVSNNGPTIRGVNTTGVLSGVESFFGGAQARITIQVDGRLLSYNEFIFGSESL